jgi:hypothetical protein
MELVFLITRSCHAAYRTLRAPTVAFRLGDVIGKRRAISCHRTSCILEGPRYSNKLKDAVSLGFHTLSHFTNIFLLLRVRNFKHAFAGFRMYRNYRAFSFSLLISVFRESETATNHRSKIPTLNNHQRKVIAFLYKWEGGGVWG